MWHELPNGGLVLQGTLTDEFGITHRMVLPESDYRRLLKALMITMQAQDQNVDYDALLR
jgi:hypothetical protein